jgi:drug/metabolite transporter (DMT)-like permease
MQAIPGEAQEFGFGKAGYYLLLAGSAIVYQCLFLGTMGAVFYGSALLAGVILTVLIPVTEVLAVLFFHEPFNGIKGIALAFSVWVWCPTSMVRYTTVHNALTSHQI